MTNTVSLKKKLLRHLAITVLMVVTASLTAYAKDHDAAALANTYTTECDKLTPEDKQTCIIRNLFALQHEQIQQLHNRIAAIETPPTAINKPSAIPHIGGALSTNSLAATGSAWGQHLLEHFAQRLRDFWLVKPKAADINRLIGALRQAA